LIPAAALLVVLALGWAPSAEAFTNYNAGGSGCVQCHPSFVKRGALHDLHVNQMTGNCGLCHTSTGDDPKTNDSGDAAGEGCRGCHGVDPMPGTPNNLWGAGLRLHHANNGIAVCAECHPSDPTPPAEDVLPLYYMRGDVNVKDSCNGDGSEDWNADDFGLDNDGDDVYDGDDPDCAMTTTTMSPTTTAPPTSTTLPTTTTVPPTTTSLPTTTTVPPTTTTLPGTTTTTMPGAGTCADPIAQVHGDAGPSEPRVVTATDALFVLRAAVGIETCAPCVCDTNGSGAVTASDALLTLSFAVGQPVELTCPPCN
jgi:hypothetical protein